MEKSDGALRGAFINYVRQVAAHARADYLRHAMLDAKDKTVELERKPLDDRTVESTHRFVGVLASPNTNEDIA